MCPPSSQTAVSAPARLSGQGMLMDACQGTARQRSQQGSGCRRHSDYCCAAVRPPGGAQSPWHPCPGCARAQERTPADQMHQRSAQFASVRSAAVQVLPLASGTCAHRHMHMGVCSFQGQGQGWDRLGVGWQTCGVMQVLQRCCAGVTWRFSRRQSCLLLLSAASQEGGLCGTSGSHC